MSVTNYFVVDKLKNKYAENTKLIVRYIYFKMTFFYKIKCLGKVKLYCTMHKFTGSK